MKELDFLRTLKSVTFSTVEKGFPKSRIADVMDVAGDTIYFLTARGKSFYKQLLDNPNVAIVGMDQKYNTIRVFGEAYPVKPEEQEMRKQKIFELNPGLGDLYNKNQRDILVVFSICSGYGDYLALGHNPPLRHQFAFGDAQITPWGYYITSDCIGCGACLPGCCTGAISEGTPYTINAKLCMECGKCSEVCPVHAVNHAN